MRTCFPTINQPDSNLLTAVYKNNIHSTISLLRGATRIMNCTVS